MVAVHLASGCRSEALQRALVGIDVFPSKTRSGFRGALEQAFCAVVVFQVLPDPSDLCWLRELVRHHSARGWILVTDFNPRNVERMVELGLPMKVVWSFEIEERLPPLVQRVLSSDPLSRLATRLEEDSGLDVDLRQTLAEVCRMPRPPRTIGGLGSLAGMTRDQMRYRWRSRSGGTFTLREFLNRVFMVRAFQARLALGSWEAVPRDLKVNRKTIRKLRRAVGTLAEAAEATQTLHPVVRAVEEALDALLAS